MVGLMLGSVRVLWPWPSGTSTTELAAPEGDIIIPVVFVVIAAAVVIVVERFSSRSAPSSS
jgi:putative membrane protein